MRRAVEGIGVRERLADAAARLALLGEPGRLALLLAIRHSDPMAVSDLALATGLSDTSTSHALRLLRIASIVSAARDGRVVRYGLCDTELVALLDTMADLLQ